MKLLKALGMAIGAFLAILIISLLIVGLIVLIHTLTIEAGVTLCVFIMVAVLTWAFYEDV